MALQAQASPVGAHSNGLPPAKPTLLLKFLGEDFIRRAKALAVKSHPNWMARHVLLRYVLQFCLALRE